MNRISALVFVLSLAAAVWVEAGQSRGGSRPAPPVSRERQSELDAPLPTGPMSKIPYSPPADAERLGDGGYRWKDPSGVVWIYRQNAFGWGRAKESEIVPAGTPAMSNALMVDQVDGELVKFRKEGPVGVQAWSRKRSELNPEEQAALRRYSEGTPPEAAAKPAAGKNVERLALPGASPAQKSGRTASKPASKEKK